ncbi:tripartite-type tricarboxylate transporter receptor subunit TctC [Bradyrhizobium sp. USDA 4501]
MPLPVNRRHMLAGLGASIAAQWLAADSGHAGEAWPTRSTHYVNGFPAGGATDTLSRLLCQKMSEVSGQSFVVENRAGAGGVLGADAIAKAPPDGYTVGLGGIAANVLAIGSYAKLRYRPREDFTFISGMWQLPNILTAKKDLFSADLKELLAAFRKEPGKYTYASAGFGTSPHLSGEMMNSMAAVHVRHVPYKGGAPALNDLLGGNVDLLFDNLPGVLPSVTPARSSRSPSPRRRGCQSFPTCRRWPNSCPATKSPPGRPDRPREHRERGRRAGQFADREGVE